MTEEDKQLLTTDLCGRLPFGVILDHPQPYGGAYDEMTSVNVLDGIARVLYDGTAYKIEDVRPYLRPLSSMTEEERRESMLRYGYREVDYYNEHHFDYRHLIDKGLAIEVTEENNPYKSN